MGSTAEDLLFWQIEPRYFERHAVKPGMTGLAQVRGFRGATARREDLSHRLHADLEYLSGWSIWRDLWIIVRTVGVCVQRNAF
jgi:lipopolysaccharide/colanic/teichoic acid biosynthesis glycosyltransferase